MTREDVEHLELIYKKLASDIGANVKNDYMVKFRRIIEGEKALYNIKERCAVGDYISVKSNDGDGYFITKITRIKWCELNDKYKYYFDFEGKEHYVYDDDANIVDRIKQI